MTNDPIHVRTDSRGVGYLTLARPAVHNAINGDMCDAARLALKDFGQDDSVRVVVISGQGASFCAGGDLQYQAAQREKSRDGRIREAQKLALWLDELDTFAKPVIARVNGPAYGGGVGLICACDVAIAAAHAKFGLSEPRLGLLPAITAPYVVGRIGARNARRLMLNAKSFTAPEAITVGILAQSVAAEHLDQAMEEEIEQFLGCAPGATAGTKALIRFVSGNGRQDNIRHTVDLAADMWELPEAEEGMRSFFEKRHPVWAKRS